ncbi:MAG: site-specific integrase, partial [Allomuricauda sp.]
MQLSAFISYLRLEKNYSEHTITAYQKDIMEFSDFCRDTYEITSIDNVEYTIIRSWIVDLVGKGISNRTVNRKISSLRAYYRFLQKIGRLNVSPLTKHRALKTNK